MRGVFRPDPNFLAIFPNLNARRFSVRTKIPGCIFQFEFEAVFVPSQYAWQYLPVWMPGVCQSEPKLLAKLPGLNARSISVRTKIPGGFPQFKCEAFFEQPEILAIFTSLNSRSFWVRTKLPGEVYQFECDAFFSQNQNSWRYFPIWMRVVFAAITKIPGKLPV